MRTAFTGWFGRRQGTRFSIFWPAIDTPAAPPVEKSRQPDIGGGKGTILLAEDELGLRLLLRQILKRQGYSVLAAADGHQAIRLWEYPKEEDYAFRADTFFVPKPFASDHLLRVVHDCLHGAHHSPERT